MFLYTYEQEYLSIAVYSCHLIVLAYEPMSEATMTCALTRKRIRLLMSKYCMLRLQLILLL